VHRLSRFGQKILGKPLKTCALPEANLQDVPHRLQLQCHAHGFGNQAVSVLRVQAAEPSVQLPVLRGQVVIHGEAQSWLASYLRAGLAVLWREAGF